MGFVVYFDELCIFTHHKDLPRQQHVSMLLWLCVQLFGCDLRVTGQGWERRKLMDSMFLVARSPLAFKLCYDVLVMQTLNVRRNEWNDTPSNQTGAISPDRHKHIPVAYKKNFCYTVSGLSKHVLYMCIINKYCLPGYLCFTVLSMFIPVRFIHLFNCFFCQILVCLDDRDKPFVKVQGYCDFISVLFSQRWFHFSSYLDWRMNWLEVTVSPQKCFWL